MKTGLLVCAFLCTLSYVYSQTTYISDNNFENYLETHTSNGQTVSVGIKKIVKQ